MMVVSTTGAGEHPDNCGRFFRKLNKKSQPKDLLDTMKFTVLGLGDTNYDYFCRAGKRFDEVFARLGGDRFHPLGCADDAVGLEQVVEPWLDGLWRALATVSGDGEARRDDVDGAEERKRDDDDALSHDEEKEKDATVTSTKSNVATFDALFPSLDVASELERVKRVPRLRKCDVKLAYQTSRTEVFGNSKVVGTMDRKEDDAQRPSRQDFVGRVVSARYLTNHVGNDKRVIHVDVDVSTSSERGEWKTGDAFGIFCRNADDVVSGVISRLTTKSIDRVDTPVRVTKGPSHLIDSCSDTTTVRELLATCCGLNLEVPPRKAFLRQLAEHCDPTSVDRLRLLYLSTKEGQGAYNALIDRQQLNVVELLSLFPSCRPPVEVILSGVPRLYPRYYSSSSSPLSDPTHVTFAFSVVERDVGGVKHLNVPARRRLGVCTSWLERSCASFLSTTISTDDDGLGGDVRAVPIRMIRRIAHGSFCPPADTSIPLILIGAGTGVSPFLGFLQHRHLLRIRRRKEKNDMCTGCWRGGFDIEETSHEDEDTAATSEGSIDLFFGCRHEKRDFIYRDELRRFESLGVLTRLHTAFSRDQDKKMYVTHRILERGKDVARLIMESHASVYVCGDAHAMARDVQLAVVRVLSEHHFSDEQAAKRYVGSMVDRGRYVLDSWS